MDRQARLGAREQDHAAHVAEDEGGAGVDGVEDVLDREDVGMQALTMSAATPAWMRREALGEARGAAGAMMTPCSSSRWRRPSVSMAP